ncbi:MAG: sugar ABC transporter permease [Anaerolineae bacterium]|nr:sugar ABC transporter permease [Anaerolineae bacterium]
MQNNPQIPGQTNTTQAKNSIGKILFYIIVPLLTFLGLWQGFIFLRDGQNSRILITLVAIVWGVGGVAMLYLISNWLVEALPAKWTRAIQPFIFVGPGVLLLTWFLALPTVRTVALSFMNDISTKFVGFENYQFAFTDRVMLEAFSNNLQWMVFGTAFCVSMGLLIAVLADRSRFETVYKAIIFMPMAISFVGAGVIWKFMYAYKGEGVNVTEIGLLNAIVVGLGGQAHAWLLQPPWNNYFLMVIMVWLQTGYAMVMFSSAIKGIPAELLEAARIDGANEFQIFFRIMIPSIQGTLITVTTTIVIFSLKLFDIVRVMTGGNNGSNVIANEFYIQQFTYGNAGRASAVAVVLLIAVIPLMIYNLQQFRDRKAF